MVTKVAEESAEQVVEAKKSPLYKLIFIISVAVVALGAGGFLGYTKFFKGSETSVNRQAAADRKILFDWEPFIVNLADPGGKRFLKLSMKMEVSSPSVLEEAKNRNFEMKDALLMLLSGKEFEDISTPAGKTALKQEIMTQLNRIMKHGQVRDIYFVEFIVQ